MLKMVTEIKQKVCRFIESTKYSPTFLPLNFLSTICQSRQFDDTERGQYVSRLIAIL